MIALRIIQNRPFQKSHKPKHNNNNKLPADRKFYLINVHLRLISIFHTVFVAAFNHKFMIILTGLIVQENGIFD